MNSTNVKNKSAELVLSNLSYKGLLLQLLDHINSTKDDTNRFRTCKALTQLFSFKHAVEKFTDVELVNSGIINLLMRQTTNVGFSEIEGQVVLISFALIDYHTTLVDQYVQAGIIQFYAKMLYFKNGSLRRYILYALDRITRVNKSNNFANEIIMSEILAKISHTMQPDESEECLKIFCNMCLTLAYDKYISFVQRDILSNCAAKITVKSRQEQVVAYALLVIFKLSACIHGMTPLITENELLLARLVELLPSINENLLMCLLLILINTLTNAPEYAYEIAKLKGLHNLTTTLTNPSYYVIHQATVLVNVFCVLGPDQIQNIIDAELLPILVRNLKMKTLAKLYNIPYETTCILYNIIMFGTFEHCIDLLKTPNFLANFMKLLKKKNSKWLAKVLEGILTLLRRCAKIVPILVKVIKVCYGIGKIKSLRAHKRLRVRKHAKAIIKEFYKKKRKQKKLKQEDEIIL